MMIDVELASGNKFIGEQDEHGVWNGKGEYFYTNGDLYTGHFKDDTMNGKGKYFYHHGDEYEGEWVEDKMEGFGIYKFASNGDYYLGEWKEDKMKGKGLRYYHNKKMYFFGDWEDDVRIHGVIFRKLENEEDKNDTSKEIDIFGEKWVIHTIHEF